MAVEFQNAFKKAESINFTFRLTYPALLDQSNGASHPAPRLTKWPTSSFRWLTTGHTGLPLTY